GHYMGISHLTLLETASSNITPLTLLDALPIYEQEAGHGFSGIARIWAGAPHWHCGSPVSSLVAHGSRTSATGRCVHAGPMGRSPTIDRSYPSSPTSECRVLVSRIMSCTPSSARICAPTP